MLKHRLITGPLMILALALIFYLDHILDHFSIDGTFLQHVFVGRTYPPAGLLTLAVLLVLIILSSRELYAIFHAKGIPANGALISLAAVLGCFLVYVIPYYADSPTSVAIFATAVVVVFLAALIQHSWLNHRTEGSVAVAAVTLFSFMYLGLLPGFYLAIRRWHDAEVVAAIILITKACDVGAYFTGRFLGRHKLIPWLSPGKTWEGLAGGVALSALVALLLAWLLNDLGLAGHWQPNPRQFVPQPYPLWLVPIAGAILGLVGQFGDLTASLFKRDAGFKDSGSSVPGFGGLLDVIDSPLIVAPVAYWLLRLAALD